jgi:CopG antitoxin of type II toxin-antitoxin system
MAESEKGKGRRGPKGGRERFQLVIPADVLDEAKELAGTENRSISNMLATLVTEAIKARKEKQWAPELMAA